jgi:DNA-binding HxlR family transcriptional regulator
MKTEAPIPGARVRGSTTGRPLMAAFDLLGRRGVLRILWELRDGAPQTFRALQEAAKLSPATLNMRLRELRAAGLIDAERGYRLTKLSQQLLPALEPLQAWSVTWAKTHGRKLSAR